jgi:hypothetical protein
MFLQYIILHDDNVMAKTFNSESNKKHFVE